MLNFSDADLIFVSENPKNLAPAYAQLQQSENVSEMEVRVNGTDSSAPARDNPTVSPPSVVIKGQTRGNKSSQNDPPMIDPATGEPVNKNLVDTVINRDWFLLFIITILFTFVGVLIYIGSNKQDSILYCTLTGFAIAYAIDHFIPELRYIVQCTVPLCIEF